MLGQVGKILILAGVFLVLVGLVFLVARHIPGLGRLPGDIHLRGKRWSVYFPLTTCIILSIILTLILWLVRYFRGR